ncbi:MAG: SGNH/GDSL hydrolase family protein [Bacteroidetes bacterium]|nr:SGNH/GDSL hydrolase family protein [Bacteroidota bacterium]
MLLGDSFTWGHSAANLTNSFADILLAKGYVVYNTGVSGADPAQYLAVAKRYIPLLKPDVVIVNFFLGNDIQYYPGRVTPFKPIHYSCNAGNLLACPNGIYFNNMQEAYRFVVAHYRIPLQNWFNKLCSLTATGTRLWIALRNNGLVNSAPNTYSGYWKLADMLKQEQPACHAELSEIKQLAARHGAKFLLLAIPELVKDQLNSPEDIPNLFNGLHYLQPVNEPQLYKSTDGHYNDAGQWRHAFVIDSVLNSSFWEH